LKKVKQRPHICECNWKGRIIFDELNFKLKINFRLKLQERSNIAGNGQEKESSMETKNESKIAELMIRLRKEAGINLIVI
jgi:hypothetical protein